MLVGEEGGHSLIRVKPDVEGFDVCPLEEKREEEEEGCEELEDEIVRCQLLSYSAFLYCLCQDTVARRHEGQSKKRSELTRRVNRCM